MLGAGSRLYRENTLTGGKDELYTYDSINRLATFDRGDLNAGKTAVTGTPVRQEDWGLDMTGNWSGYVRKTSGSTDLDQDRSHNRVNEITDITETVGAAWATPVHDRAGNMTSVPKPSDPADSLTLTRDAWNRLVEVKDGSTVVGAYAYDGRNRRVKRQLDNQAPGNPDGIDTYVHYFYNDAWQVLETRETATESDEPENLQPQYQYVWSPRYVDAAVLRDENTDADGLCDDQRLYYLGDANFNVTCLVDTGGDAVERYVYAPYGELTVLDGAFGSRCASVYANPYTFTGRRLDGESGLYYYRNRVYAAQLGRFVGRDPLGSPDGMDAYAYVDNAPGRRTDPRGLKRLGEKWDVPDFFWWYFFGFGQDVPLDQVGLLIPWWYAIKGQVLVKLKLDLVPALESQLSCEHYDAPSEKLEAGPLEVRVAAGGGMTNPLTIMGNSIVKVRGTCEVTLRCRQCCDGERIMTGSSGTCDLDLNVRDTFQNPLDRGGIFEKHDWPMAKPYDLVASWNYEYTWNNTYDTRCPED